MSHPQVERRALHKAQPSENTVRQALLLGLALSQLGCPPPSKPAPPRSAAPLTLRFLARVGAEPFACGRQYDGLGVSRSRYEPMDLRLYVHDVRLVTTDQREVPFVLSEDEFQRQGIALLDFEDASGACKNGTSRTHTALTGSAPPGEYTGLRFRVGVPAEQNHQDASTAAAPLDELGLFWSWRMGYLFFRAEGRTTGLPQGHNVHIGSTACTPPPDGRESGWRCATENVFEVSLSGADPRRQTVILDLARLFAGSDLDRNTDETALGCMSFEGDPECAPLFHQLGLRYGDQPAPSSQAVFVME